MLIVRVEKVLDRSTFIEGSYQSRVVILAIEVVCLDKALVVIKKPYTLIPLTLPREILKTYSAKR